MIIFTGVAGSGKSSQGKILADEFGLAWVSTGEFLRMLISGERRKDMVAGKLLADHEIIEMVQKILQVVDTRKEFILDGFPRTQAQADWLLSQVKHGQLEISVVIHLRASEPAVKERLISRGRPDDTDQAIARRFSEYKDTIVPLLDDFKKAGIRVFDINAEQDLEKVHDDIRSALASVLT